MNFRRGSWFLFHSTFCIILNPLLIGKKRVETKFNMDINGTTLPSINMRWPRKMTTVPTVHLVKGQYLKTPVALGLPFEMCPF